MCKGIIKTEQLLNKIKMHAAKVAINEESSYFSIKTDDVDIETIRDAVKFLERNKINYEVVVKHGKVVFFIKSGGLLAFDNYIENGIQVLKNLGKNVVYLKKHKLSGQLISYAEKQGFKTMQLERFCSFVKN